MLVVAVVGLEYPTVLVDLVFAKALRLPQQGLQVVLAKAHR